MADEYTYEPYLWFPVCKLAVAEKDPEHRQQLLIEAQRAVLERAYGLGETPGDDLECAVLDEAATVIGHMVVKERCDSKARYVPDIALISTC